MNVEYWKLIHAEKNYCVDMNGSVSIGDKGWKFPQLNSLSLLCVFEKGWEINLKL